jgi:hypothetical protein
MFSFFITSIPPESAHPYLDPVSGGAILQTLLAILLGIAVFFRSFWRKINSIIVQIRERFSKKEDSSLAGNTTKKGE